MTSSAAGSSVAMGEEVVAINTIGQTVISVTTRNVAGEEKDWPGEQFIVSLPLQEAGARLLPCTSRQGEGRGKAAEVS